MQPVRVGVIGCGNISGIYFENMTSYEPLDVIACADLNSERAKAAAEKYGIPNVLTPDELIAHPDIEIVVNLTVPQAHDPVNRQAVEASKSVYVEKPLAVTTADAKETLRIAKQNGVLVGCAPDTFLGAGIQTCRKLIDDGAIGTPLGCNGFMIGSGVETWHPNPMFYYQVGGGPLMDMGPYYLTALINLMGGVQYVSGAARVSYPQRFVTSEPFNGTVIDVETPTHIITVMEFASGAIGQLTTSFDVHGSKLSNIEVYGTEGSLLVPDPNGFGGPVFMNKRGTWDWQEVELTHGYAQNSRGLGVMDMAYALRNGRPQRAGGDLAYHVLDIMESSLEAGTQGVRKELTSGVAQPAAMPTGLPANALDG